MIIDPFGHRWPIATPREEPSVADLEARGDEWLHNNPELASVRSVAAADVALRRRPVVACVARKERDQSIGVHDLTC
jgi:hypothetical protein